MNRRIILLSAACAAVLLVAGTGGFSAMSAERTVDVAVVDDDSAYLRIANDDPLQCGSPPENAVVQNQIGMPLTTVEISVAVPSDEDGEIRVGTNGGGQTSTLAPGEHKRLTFDDEYRSGDGPVVTIEPVDGTTPEVVEIGVIEVSGDGMSISVAERTFTVDCATQRSETPTGTSDGGEGQVG